MTAKRVLLRSLVAGVASLAALALAEGVLRLAGFEPWVPRATDAREPRVVDEDPELGWRSRPGSHVFPAYSPEGRETTMTITAGGARRTAAAAGAPGRPQALVVGCSFAQGWALDDQDSMPWRLQERLPEAEVVSFATGGYGTYQSLLLLERVLPGMERAALVVYGFIPHHEKRNVAAASWLRTLLLYSRRSQAAPPFVTLTRDGGLARHPPTRWLALPGRRFSAAVAAAETAWMRLAAARREVDRRQVTELLLLELDRLCRRHRARLLVALLWVDDGARAEYTSFLADHGVAAVDCSVPLTRAMTVPGEGHPNAQVAATWAACLASRVRAELSTNPTTATSGGRT